MAIKELELRILRYLSVVDNLMKTVKHIHNKFGYEYQYICKTLREMNGKGLVGRHEKNSTRNAVVYDITKKGRSLLK